MTSARKPGAGRPVATVEAIRGKFPALRREEQGLAVAYFDGPGGTQVPRPVVDAVTDYLLNHNANTHWAYPTSEETDALLAASRRALADFLNAGPDEVAFGANMTTMTFHLARALGRGFGPGDEVVVTELDHHANVAPWQALAQERGVTVRAARMDPLTCRVDMDDLARCVTERTRVLAVGAASNALGTVTDVRAAARLAHDAGALVFVDAVHSAPHCLVDVKDLGCDFLACSAYKFYGPHVGVLYGRRDLLQSLDVPKLQPAPDTAPERLETGTQNHEGVVGASAAVEFLASLSGGPEVPRRERLRATFGGLHERASALVGQLWDGLRSVPGVTVYGPPPGAPRTPTVSFAVSGRPADEVARALVPRGVFVSHGDFYASTAVRRLGHAHDGLVRAGCACYTTAEEVARLVEGVNALAGGRPRRP
jgi:cysteine desulfurase family protein (TIGR01976 family)